MNETNFLPTNKYQNFLQTDSTLWVYVACYSQSTQNNKFVISLQYLKENMKDEIDFLPVDKYKRLFLIDIIILCLCDQVG